MDVSIAVSQIVPLLNWSQAPLNMPSLMALAAGMGWDSGLRLYALLFVLGALDRFAGVTLPGDLDALSNVWVMGLSGVLLLTEFFADKVLWLDSFWDALHTFIRIPAGAMLAGAVMGDQGSAIQIATGLLGGTLAAGTHFAKASTRAAINTSPEPVSNIAASTTEDALFAGGMWAMLNHPLVFLAGLVVFGLVAVGVIVVFWRFVKRVFRRGRVTLN